MGSLETTCIISGKEVKVSLNHDFANQRHFSSDFRCEYGFQGGVVFCQYNGFKNNHCNIYLSLLEKCSQITLKEEEIKLIPREDLNKISKEDNFSLEGIGKSNFHIVQQLIGIKGSSRQEIIKYILISWIGEHQEELGRYGISVEAKKGKFTLS